MNSQTSEAGAALGPGATTFTNDGGAAVSGPATIAPAAPLPTDAASAQAEIAAIRAAARDPTNALNHSATAEGRALQERLLKLYEIAAPGMSDDAESTAAAVAAAPATPEGYAVDKVRFPTRSDPRDEAADRAAVADARAIAHAAGLSQGEFNVIAGAQAELQQLGTHGDARVDQFIDRGLATLEQIWGRDFDRNIAGARALVHQLGAPAIEFLRRTGLENHPQVVRLAVDAARRRGLIKA